MKRRAARRASGLAAAGLVALAGLAVGARFADGPLGPFPGGPLRGHEETGSEPDWSFAAGLETVELEVGGGRPRSILTGVLVDDGRLYVPTTLAPLKRWPGTVHRHPDVRVRVAGRLFERRARRVTDAARLADLASAARAKYGPPYHHERLAAWTWFFRLDPTS